MERLRALPRPDLDRLGKVQLIAIAIGLQNLIASREDIRIQSQLPTSRRPSHERPDAFGGKSTKLIHAAATGRQIGRQLLSHTAHGFVGQQTLDDHGTLTRDPDEGRFVGFGGPRPLRGNHVDRAVPEGGVSLGQERDEARQEGAEHRPAGFVFRILRVASGLDEGLDGAVTQGIGDVRVVSTGDDGDDQIAGVRSDFIG